MTFKIINHLLFNLIESLFLPLCSLVDLYTKYIKPTINNGERTCNKFRSIAR